MKKGILIFATRHPYYGRLAYNLACTIKAQETIAVAVAVDEVGLTHLGAHQKNIFDRIIELPADYPIGFATKLYADLVSPFDHTLVLDADMLWVYHKKPAELFGLLEGLEYTGITEGWIDLANTADRSNVRLDYHFWADIDEIKEKYNLTSGILYQWRSEVIYFEKSQRVTLFFETARKVYSNAKQLNSIIAFVDESGKQNIIPDELCINISAAIHEFSPHKVRWTPAYWHKVNNDVTPHPADLVNWYLVSFGNHWSNGSVKKLYDKLASNALKRLGRQHVFSLHSKKEYLPERFKK